jgi:hypothetical protein
MSVCLDGLKYDWKDEGIRVIKKDISALRRKIESVCKVEIKIQGRQSSLEKVEATMYTTSLPAPRALVEELEIVILPKLNNSAHRRLWFLLKISDYGFEYLSGEDRKSWPGFSKLKEYKQRAYDVLRIYRNMTASTIQEHLNREIMFTRFSTLFTSKHLSNLYAEQYPDRTVQ